MIYYLFKIPIATKINLSGLKKMINPNLSVDGLSYPKLCQIFITVMF